MTPNLPPENLGTLEAVPLRAIWSDEAQSFTPWLARAENLKRLGDVLGLDLTTEDQEVAVGPFSADILCKALPTGVGSSSRTRSRKPTTGTWARS